jgi:hypothetical protein
MNTLAVSAFPWWTPLPWLLTAIAITIAIIAFRRGRLASVRIHSMEVNCLGRGPSYDYHEYFRVELLCTGADVYGLELFLECDHSYREHGRQQPLVRKFEFKPLGELPVPLKNGQVVAFELGDHDFRDLVGRRWFDPHTAWP